MPAVILFPPFVQRCVVRQGGVVVVVGLPVVEVHLAHKVQVVQPVVGGLHQQGLVPVLRERLGKVRQVGPAARRTQVAVHHPVIGDLRPAAGGTDGDGSLGPAPARELVPQDGLPVELSVQLQQPRRLGLVVDGVRPRPVHPFDNFIDARHTAASSHRICRAAARRRPAFWVLLLHRADPQAVVLHIQPAVVARHALNRVASIAVCAVRYNDRRFKIKSGTRREVGGVHVAVVHGAVGVDAVREADIRARGAQAPVDSGRRLVQIGDALCVVGEIAERLALRLPAAHARLRAGDSKALAVDRVQRRHLVALRHHNGDGDQALPDFLVQFQRPDAVTEVVQGAAEVTVFVAVAVGCVPCDLTESILADKGHARAGAVVVIVQLDELGGLAVFRQLHQAAVCQIGK